MHIYPSREQGLRNKATYQVWEYGEKPDVRFSPYGGDVEDALTAIRTSAVDRAVAVNLFAIDRARAAALAELPAELDEAARHRAIAEIDATMGDRLKRSNRQFCDSVRDHPELVPVVAADPWALDSEEGQAHLREMVTARGARGVKVHPVLQRFSMNDRRMYPIYETCRDLGVPVIAHAGPSRTGPQCAEPRAFADVLRAFPDLPIVLAHLGGGAWRQALEIARAFPNAQFDCCEILAWTGATNAPDDEQLARLIRDIGSEAGPDGHRLPLVRPRRDRGAGLPPPAPVPRGEGRDPRRERGAAPAPVGEGAGRAGRRQPTRAGAAGTSASSSTYAFR